MTRCLLFAPICAAALLIPTDGAAQPAPAEPAPKKPSLVGKLSGAFSGPLHPVVKGVSSGGGIGVGVGYDLPTLGQWETTTRVIVTVKRYWSAEIGTAYRGERNSFEAYARLREMSQLSFFGPGRDSDVEARTSFLLRDPVVGAVARRRVLPWMAVGGRFEEMWPELGVGRSTRFPTIAARFADIEAPGLIDQPRFGRYQGFVEFEAPAGAGQALNQGGAYRAGYSMYDDQNVNRFGFRRLDLEGQHRFAVFGGHRRLTLHGWVATTDPGAGNTVPFYLQPTLGGNGQLRSPNEELIGSDGSKGTLRGFRDYRFRDRNLLLLQAEYRIPVWGPIDTTVYVDAGKVTHRAADLDLTDLKHNYGFSVSLMRARSTVARTDVAFGGGEGVKFSFTFGVSGELIR